MAAGRSQHGSRTDRSQATVETAALTAGAGQTHRLREFTRIAGDWQIQQPAS